MRNVQRLVVAAAASTIALGAARAQTITQSSLVLSAAPTLKTFTPIDSLFVNSSAQSFNITLLHTMSGTATEYRVSRFADFRDASWVTYNARPTLIVPHGWFTNVGTDGTHQEVTLHFQLRARNPRGGTPTSAVPGQPIQTAPDFFFSDVRVGHVRLIFVG